MLAQFVSNLTRVHDVFSFAANTYSAGVVWRRFGNYTFRKGILVRSDVLLLNA
jgi:hypothetical protein